MSSEAAPESYEPKAILLTGGCGFIGSHVLDKLLAELPPTVTVVNLDALESVASLKNTEAASKRPNYHFENGRIEDASFVNRVIKRYNIDTIMHFAAESHVDKSFGNSFSFTRTNVFGTHVLLEAARLHQKRVRRFIHVSTDEVYGEGDDDGDSVPSRTVLRPTNPYAATKAAAEMLVHAYMVSYKLPCIITRGNNVYGPRQFPEKLIPKFTLQILNDLKCTLHGDGTPRRSYMHVFDVANAFLTILRKGLVGHIYNIGTKREIMNKDVTRGIVEHLKGDEQAKQWEDYVVFTEDRPWNDSRYNIDSSALQALGWKEEVDFESGLKSTIDWYVDHLDYWEPVVYETILRAAFPVKIRSVSMSSAASADLYDSDRALEQTEPTPVPAPEGGEGK